jgi:hypothetical protein
MLPGGSGFRVFGHVPDPGKHALRGDPEEERDARHGHPTQGPQGGVDLRGAGLTACRRAGKLVAALCARLLGLTSSRTVFAEPITSLWHRGQPGIARLLLRQEYHCPGREV